VTSAGDGRARLSRAGLWTIGGTAVHMAFGVLASILAARILGATHFGELSIVRTTFFTVTLLTGASLGTASSHIVAKLHGSDPERTGRVIGLLLNFVLVTGVAAMVAGVMLAGWVARKFGAPQLTGIFTATAPYIVFASLSAVHIGVLTGLEAFGAASMLLALEGVLTGIMIVIAAHLNGVAGAALAMMVAAALTLAGRNRVLKHECRRRGIVIHHRHVGAEFPLIRAVARVWPRRASLRLARARHSGPRIPWARGVGNLQRRLRLGLRGSGGACAGDETIDADPD